MRDQTNLSPVQITRYQREHNFTGLTGIRTGSDFTECDEISDMIFSEVEDLESWASWANLDALELEIQN